MSPVFSSAATTISCTPWRPLSVAARAWLIRLSLQTLRAREISFWLGGGRSIKCFSNAFMPCEMGDMKFRIGSSTSPSSMATAGFTTAAEQVASLAMRPGVFLAARLTNRRSRMRRASFGSLPVGRIVENESEKPRSSRTALRAMNELSSDCNCLFNNSISRSRALRVVGNSETTALVGALPRISAPSFITTLASPRSTSVCQTAARFSSSNPKTLPSERRAASSASRLAMVVGAAPVLRSRASFASIVSILVLSSS